MMLQYRIEKILKSIKHLKIYYIVLILIVNIEEARDIFFL